MKKILLLSAITLVSLGLSRQSQAQIITDRPDLTESAISVEKSRLQIEAGSLYESIDGTHSYQVSNYLFRYGLGKGLELRLAGAFDVPEAGSFSVSALELGFKYEFIQEEGMMPQTAFIAHYTNSKFSLLNQKANLHGMNARLSLSHTLSEQTAFGYNLGFEAMEQVDTQLFYTATIAHALDSKNGLFIELYGNLNETGWVDGGYTYLIDTEIQFDASVGHLLSTATSAYFISAGISLKF